LRSRLPWAVVIAALVVWVATSMVGCGVPVDRSPRPLANVPFQLAPQNPPTTKPNSSDRTAKVAVFMVRQNRLVSVDREVPAPVTLRGVLNALLEGPTKDEAKTGLQTAIVGRGSVISAAQDGNVGRVNLSSQWGDFANPDQVAAIAQMVFTATGVPGIDGVAFSLSGKAIEAFTGDGSQIARPLQRSDFQDLFPA